MGLVLGGVTFADFEVPSSITFGGNQSVVVHRLQGGARVVDALGPDDADIRWSGIISGGDATVRAQMLDQLRIAGTEVPLTWDSFFYSVVITELHFSFNNCWWIPYEIRCLVADDPGIQNNTITIDLLSAVSADLVSASAYVDVSSTMAALSGAGMAGLGSTAYAAASVALTVAYQAVSDALQSATPFNDGDIDNLVILAKSTAALGAARGYIGRASVNYAQIG